MTTGNLNHCIGARIFTRMAGHAYHDVGQIVYLAKEVSRA